MAIIIHNISEIWNDPAILVCCMRYFLIESRSWTNFNNRFCIFTKNNNHWQQFLTSTFNSVTGCFNIVIRSGIFNLGNNSFLRFSKETCPSLIIFWGNTLLHIILNTVSLNQLCIKAFNSSILVFILIWRVIHMSNPRPHWTSRRRQFLVWSSTTSFGSFKDVQSRMYPILWTL